MRHAEHHPRVKRQFQPAITSFLARNPRDTDDPNDPNVAWDERGPGPITRACQHHNASAGAASAHLQPPKDLLAPPVPGRVQADLLSVGMRVRKSVPEGYKTHKSPATLPSIQTTLSSRSPTGGAATGPGRDGAEDSAKPPREAVPDALQHQRELLPFCGLHKIGGYAEQPVTNTHLYHGTNADGDRPVNPFPLPAEAFSQPFSSQSSTDSNSSVSTAASSVRPNPANPYKRSWQEEDAHSAPTNLNSSFLFAVPTKVTEDEVPVSPLSETPSQNVNALPRTFAQPKSRRQGARMLQVDGTAFKETDIDMDVENAERPERRVAVGYSSDFDEAEFLVRPWSDGSEREVDMGGV